MFATSRKLNLISLEHICIPATCCCDDVSRGEGTTRVGERQRDSELQSLSPVEPPPLQAQGELQQACTSHLTCFALICMHDSGHTHQVKLRILRMQVYIAHLSTSIGHMRSSYICTRKASWGEQGTRRVHTILLRAELPGSIGIGDCAIWE